MENTKFSFALDCNQQIFNFSFFSSGVGVKIFGQLKLCWTVLVCCGLQASLGGHVRLMITGAAPISPDVLTFLRVAMGCQVPF